MSDGPAYRTSTFSPSLPLTASFLSSSSSVPLLPWCFNFLQTVALWEIMRVRIKVKYLFVSSSLFTPLLSEQQSIQECWAKITTVSSSSASFALFFPSYIFPLKYKFVVFNAAIQKRRPQNSRQVGKVFKQRWQLTITAFKRSASHAWKAAATRKPSFTMSAEGDVFYVYVKRQFMSTEISADECLWTFLFGVPCC